jgi:hypothetical protein
VCGRLCACVRVRVCACVPDVGVLGHQRRDLQVEQRGVRQLEDLRDGSDGVTQPVCVLSLGGSGQGGGVSVSHLSFLFPTLLLVPVLSGRSHRVGVVNTTDIVV